MKHTMTINNIEYNVIKLLGHGKGGYSYLAQKDGKQYVLKQIHHEPCDYYTFGNKIESENNDYKKLMETGIRLPKMLDIDIEAERILKEYIDGPTNFVVQDDLIYYIDYECNNYMDEWNFENWGIKYWSKTQEFLDYLSSHK